MGAGLPALLAPKDGGDQLMGLAIAGAGVLLQLQRLQIVPWTFGQTWPVLLILGGFLIVTQALRQMGGTADRLQRGRGRREGWLGPMSAPPPISPRGRLSIGLVLITLGLVLTLGQAGLVHLEGLGRLWPLLFIGIGLVKVRQPLEDGQRAIGVALLCAASLLLGISVLSWGRAWPLLLVLVGALLLWQALDSRRLADSAPPEAPFLSELAFMGGAKRSPRMADFRGGYITAVLGGVDLDLRKARMGPSAVLDVVAVWGGIELKVPSGWSVEGKVMPIMGAFEDKTQVLVESAERPSPRRARIRHHGGRGDRQLTCLWFSRAGGGSLHTPWLRSPWRRRPVASSPVVRRRSLPDPPLLVAVPLAFAGLGLLLPVRYVCRTVPLGPPFTQGLALHALGTALSGLAWVYLGAVITRFLSPYFPEAALPARYEHHVPVVLAAGALLYLLSASLQYTQLAQEATRRAEQDSLELRVLARDAELRALKAQVHPHFLFNSLNSISALTASDPPRAREMCILLSEFFRQGLALGERSERLPRGGAAAGPHLPGHRGAASRVTAGRGRSGRRARPGLSIATAAAAAAGGERDPARDRHPGRGRGPAALRPGPTARASAYRSRTRSMPRRRPGPAWDWVFRTCGNGCTPGTAMRGSERREHPGPFPGDALAARAGGRVISVLIVDDEEPARAVLREMLSREPDVRILGECATGLEAVKAAAELKPQALFLDIEMPKLDGFEVLELIDPQIAVVFVTAYDSYALRAFEVHAVDYVLKPFRAERLREALEGARARVAQRPEPAVLAQSARRAGEYARRIVVKDGARIHLIPVEQLEYRGGPGRLRGPAERRADLPQDPDPGQPRSEPGSGGLRARAPLVPGSPRPHPQDRALREEQPRGDPGRRHAGAGEPRGARTPQGAARRG